MKISNTTAKYTLIGLVLLGVLFVLLSRFDTITVFQLSDEVLQTIPECNFSPDQIYATNTQGDRLLLSEEDGMACAEAQSRYVQLHGWDAEGVTIIDQR